MTRAWQLIGYFKVHVRRVHGVLTSTAEIEKAEKVLAWIDRKKMSEFTKRDAFQGLKGSTMFRKVCDLDEPLELLVRHDYLSPQPGKKSPGGRPSGPRYKVNPHHLSPKSSKGVE